jgi:LmeA-like phospholipid-binding
LTNGRSIQTKGDYVQILQQSAINPTINLSLVWNNVGMGDSGVAMALIQTGAKPLIGSILSKAIGLWLRSQVDKIDHLQLNIEGSNRSLLSGDIPGVSVAAENAIYQGLHLTQVQLQGSNIRFNLGQVLKGQPLHLLEPFFVTGNLHLNQLDLNQSLQAPMLVQALNEFVLSLLIALTQSSSQSTYDLQNQQNDSWVQSVQRIQDPQILIETDHLILNAQLLFDSGELLFFQLKTGLEIANFRELMLVQPQVQIYDIDTELHLDNYIIDLGSDIKIQDLILSPGLLEIQATLKINP